MEQILKFTILLTILGGLSSGIGAFFGIILNLKKFQAKLYEVTAGIMTGIVCFDMLPECFELSNVFNCIFGVIIGVIFVYYLDKMIENYNLHTKKKKYSLLGIVVVISMAMHNILEGFAMGTSVAYSISFSISLIISIFLHDIPEGMIVGITSKDSKTSTKSVMISSIMVGISVGIGVLVGQIIGGISVICTALSLSIAGGAMLYIVACELIPSSNKIEDRKSNHIMYIVGLLIGLLMSRV